MAAQRESKSMFSETNRVASEFETVVPAAGWKPAVFSFGLHLLLFAAILYFWRSTAEIPSGESMRSVELVLAETTPEQSTTYFDQTQALPPTTTQPELAAVLPQALPESVTVEGASAPAEPTLPSVSRDAAAMAQAAGSKSSGAGGGGQLSAAELEAIAEEQRLLAAAQPRGEPATLQVFGSGGLTGRKFVFVLDRSNSMGSGGLGVLDQAAVELQQAVNQLSEVHHFQVVAYNHSTEMIAARALLPADAGNKAQVQDFVRQLAAFGATEHELGLIAALALKPDVIVLMTDGGLPELSAFQMDTIRRMAGPRTQIHCLQFGAGPLQASTPFLQTLAHQNHGSFRYIDVNDWK